MSDTTTKDGEVMREIASLTSDTSETAASAHNRLYKPTGIMEYCVVLANGAARTNVFVKADSGDNAALMGLARCPGQKVAYVGPAGDAPRDTTDDFAGV